MIVAITNIIDYVNIKDEVKIIDLNFIIITDMRKIITIIIKMDFRSVVVINIFLVMIDNG